MVHPDSALHRSEHSGCRPEPGAYERIPERSMEDTHALGLICCDYPVLRFEKGLS